VFYTNSDSQESNNQIVKDPIRRGQTPTASGKPRQPSKAAGSSQRSAAILRLTIHPPQRRKNAPSRGEFRAAVFVTKRHHSGAVSAVN
jgi:hypothetical protein